MHHTTKVTGVYIAPCADVSNQGDVEMATPTDNQFWSVYTYDQNHHAHVPVGGDHNTQFEALEHARAVYPNLPIEMLSKDNALDCHIPTAQRYKAYYIQPVLISEHSGERVNCNSSIAQEFDVVGVLAHDSRNLDHSFEAAVFPDKTIVLSSHNNKLGAETLLGALLQQQPKEDNQYEEYTD